MTKSVEIVVITKIIPVYKDTVEASNINVVNFSFSNGDECAYNVITQKGLYEVGSKAIYIQPDYCLSDLPIFESFLRPFGDESKCRLGKNFRIRALKFNFQFDNSSDPIYSFGILMPLDDVNSYINTTYNEDDLSEILGITKYEDPEDSGSGLIKGDFPSHMYKTDEENINNIKSHVSRVINSGQELGISIKVDGSSISIYFKKESDEWVYGICSRNQEKKIEQFYIDKYVDIDNNEYHKYIDPTTKVKGWYCDNTSIFMTQEEIDASNMSIIKRDVIDSWVEVSTKHGFVENGLEYCKNNNVELVFRGELNGSGLKGSGNKQNPHSNSKQNIILFGVDSLETGFSKRQHYGNDHNLKVISEVLDLPITYVQVVKPNSYEDLISYCDNIFKEEKSQGRLIEGVVIRTMHSNDLSCKYLSPEYDSKK